MSIQDILYPVRDLDVWDRFAVLPDGAKEYQVLIRWFPQSLSYDNSQRNKREVVGHGQTPEAAAVDAMNQFIEELRSNISRLENRVSTCVTTLKRTKASEPSDG